MPVEPSEPEEKPVISYGNTFTATWIFKEATASIWSSSWTGEFADGSLLESHLTFSDVYGSKYVHYPLYAKPAATFREKIAQLRNYLPIFVYAWCVFPFCCPDILKISEIIKYFRVFNLAFCLIITCET